MFTRHCLGPVSLPSGPLWAIAGWARRAIAPACLHGALLLGAITTFATITPVAKAGDDQRQYGGTLDIGTVYYTLSALSWDPVDWSWKINHDTGLVREQLFAGDLTKSVRNGGQFPFMAEAYIPKAGLRGELAESWGWEDDLTLVVNLRKGIMFHGKPGMMARRELVASDVVFSFYNVEGSPKKIPTYFDHVDLVEARDKHTVVFHFNEFNAEWDYRFGYGFHSSIVPKEMADIDAKDWRFVTGTGPFELSHYIQANEQKYRRRDDYWGREMVGGKPFQLPYVDEISYRIIKDEATILTALRTAKIDILESIRWIVVDHLKESTPELQWSRWLTTGGNFVTLRVDREPFDDIRVRRALNLAVNQQEIVDLYYGGHAELMAYPQHPGFGEYFQTLDEMPESVKELFSYNPEKARQLLAEAGFPDGFSFKVQVCSCSANNMDLIPLLDDYLSKVGVSIEIVPMEYASFLSAMTTRTHEAGYFMNNGHTNPTTSLRKSFKAGQTWNPSQWDDPAFDQKVVDLHLERDEAKRIAMIRAMTIEMIDNAPYIWLPTEYIYSAWWPWVKNYGGELRAGAARPGPIYARVWVDEKLKSSMGFD